MHTTDENLGTSFLRAPSDAYGQGGRAYAVRGEASGFFASGVWAAMLAQTVGARLAPAPAPPGHRLGDLSMRYETGFPPAEYRKAAAVVSHGRGDPGGKSYGAYQLASKMGMPQAFLQREGRRWAGEFRDMDPTVPGPFERAWIAIAEREPDEFFAAQHDFIKRTRFDTVVSHVLRATSVDCEHRSAALADVTWSMAVQHGRAKFLIAECVRRVQANPRVQEPQFDRVLINALYDRREVYVVSHPQKAGLLNRYRDERRLARAMLDGRT